MRFIIRQNRLFIFIIVINKRQSTQMVFCDDPFPFLSSLDLEKENCLITFTFPHFFFFFCMQFLLFLVFFATDSFSFFFSKTFFED